MENFQIGPFLKRLRQAQNLTTRELEERSKVRGKDSAVGHSQVSNIENGKHAPEFQTLQKIAAALGCPLTIVLDGSQAEPDTITILSTEDLAEALIEALKRPEVLTLLTYFLQLNKEQQNAMLELFRSFNSFKWSLEQSSETTQEIPQEGEE